MSQMLLLSFSRILTHLALFLSLSTPSYAVLQANDFGIILHVVL